MVPKKVIPPPLIDLRDKAASAHKLGGPKGPKGVRGWVKLKPADIVETYLMISLC